MKTFFIYVSYLICSMWMLLCLQANAACYMNQGGASLVVNNIAQPAITVQRDTPVGTELWRVSTTNGGIYESCDSQNSAFYYEMVLFTTPSGLANVYNTNVPGVGVMVVQDNTSYFYTSPAFKRSFPIAAASFTSRSIIFYKTGDIVSGVVSSGLLARNYGDGDGVDGAEINISGASVTQLACSITTPGLVFPVGDVLASQFGSTVGTTPTSAQNTQNLGLDCDAGANINVQLNGTQNPDVSTTSVLALTGQGGADVASGVGVQLLYNGVPLELNNPIVLKQSAGGQETFPITARYYQTKTSITTGKANASATLDLTYQ